jgi:hypothetical protein
MAVSVVTGSGVLASNHGEPAGRLCRIAAAVTHQFLSTLFVGLLIPQITGIWFRAKSTGHSGPFSVEILNKYSLFPFHILFAMLLGLSLGTLRKDRWMKWVWVLPLVLFVLAALTMRPSLGLPAIPPKPSQTFWTRFFGHGCLPDRLCPEQFTTTMPLLCSVSYAVAAWLAQRTIFNGSKARDIFRFISIGLGILLLLPLAYTAAVMTALALQGRMSESLAALEIPGYGISLIWIVTGTLIVTGLPASVGSYLIGSARRRTSVQ